MKCRWNSMQQELMIDQNSFSKLFIWDEVARKFPFSQCEAANTNIRGSTLRFHSYFVRCVHTHRIFVSAPYRALV